MGKIAQNLIDSFHKRSQDLMQISEQFAEDLPTILPSPEELAEADYDPQHILYIAAQSFASLFGDAVCELDEFQEYAQIVERAEDEYQPSTPPMSPITHSFFWTWALFDLRFGADGETMGGCLLELMRSMQAPDDMLSAMEKYNNSRMGIYQHRGTRAGKIQLRELVTGDELVCHSTSGYRGVRNELWYVRLAPPLSDDFHYHIAVTTPYVLTEVSAEDWTAFLNKHLLVADDKRQALGDLLKYGNERVNWMEFVFQAYHHDHDDAIYLAGIPDVPASLPHGPVHGERQAVTGTNGDEGVRVKFSEAQRKIIARLWPNLAPRLRLDEKKDRIVKLQRSDLERINREGRTLLSNAQGYERNSLRKVIQVAVEHGSQRAVAGQVYQLRVELAGSDPLIWRRIQVRDGTLEELHFHLQSAMGWQNSHLHVFEIRGERYSSPPPFEDMEFDDTDDAGVRISELVPANGKLRFKYMYDFGDGWEHLIELEVVSAAEAKIRYPRCTGGEQACPPEDCGGIWGFYDFVAAITDRKHPEHRNMMEWYGPFTPGAFDQKMATRAMHRWAQ